MAKKRLDITPQADALEQPLAEAPEFEQKKGRVLVDCQIGSQSYKVNDIVLADAPVIAAAESLGLIDSNEAAVAYAESLVAPKG